MSHYLLHQLVLSSSKMPSLRVDSRMAGPLAIIGQRLIRSRMLSQAMMAASGKDALPQRTISVMTYNILAQKYAQSGWHSYCQSRHLRWKYRKDLLLEELQAYDSDIICLQEVEAQVFARELQPWMAERGYRGHYLARHYGENVQGPPEGVALFYRTEVFELLQHSSVIFSSLPTDPPAPIAPWISSSDCEDAEATAAATVTDAGGPAAASDAPVPPPPSQPPPPQQQRRQRGDAASFSHWGTDSEDELVVAAASAAVAKDNEGAAAGVWLAAGTTAGDTTVAPGLAAGDQPPQRVCTVSNVAVITSSALEASPPSGAAAAAATPPSNPEQGGKGSCSSSDAAGGDGDGGAERNGNGGVREARSGRNKAAITTKEAAASTTAARAAAAAVVSVTSTADSEAPPGSSSSSSAPRGGDAGSTSGRSSNGTSSNGSSSVSSSGRKAPRGNNEFWSVFSRRKEGAILALLRHRRTQRRLLAAVTHLFWNPAFPDVKAFQAAVLCGEMAAFLQRHTGGGGSGGSGAAADSVPVVLAGDFNSLSRKRVPDMFDPKIPRGPDGLVSGVYTLLTRGSLPPDHPDHPASRRRPGETGNPDFHGVKLTTAGIRLTSAYRLANGRDPPLTTRTPTFAGCLDYIFVSPQHFDVTSALDLPYDLPAGSYDAVRDPLSDVDFPPIPNGAYPSDHLSLVALLKFKD